MILEKIAKRSLIGTLIKAVKHTGDLGGKRGRIVFDVYDRLSHGKTLLPPAIGFLFDSDARTEGDKKSLKCRSPNRAHFLPRRTYENYLLNPAAIADVTNGLENFREDPVTESEVKVLIEQKRTKPKYFNLDGQHLGLKSTHGVGAGGLLLVHLLPGDPPHSRIHR